MWEKEFKKFNRMKDGDNKFFYAIKMNALIKKEKQIENNI